MGTYWANSACACTCATCMEARLCSTYFLVGKKIYMFMIFPSRNLLATLFSNVHGLVLWRAQTELCLYVSSVLVYLFRIVLFNIFFLKAFLICMYPCMSVSMMAVYIVLFFERYMLFILFFLLPVRFTLLLSNLMQRDKVGWLIQVSTCRLAYVA